MPYYQHFPWTFFNGVSAQTGVTFLANNSAGSDIRMVWAGADLLSRTSHTAIWKAKYFQQTGYYAVAWHSYHDNTWHAGYYEFGTHPYPTTGTYDATTGQSTGGTSSSGTVHYYEIAGLAANDFIASPDPGGPGAGTLITTKDIWVTQARKCEVIGGTTLRHTFWPDIENNPTFSIVQEIALSNLPSPSAPAFYFGSSDWTIGGNTNAETPGCTLRGIMLFDAPLSLADITTEAANESSDAAVTTAGIASVFYCNKNPTPTDISDKQTQRTAHSPVWDNANRPTLFTG